MLWFIILLLSGLISLMLWRTFRSHSTLKMESIKQRNIAIAHERSREIESAYEAGDLDTKEYDLAIKDLQLSLADELVASKEMQQEFRASPATINFLLLAIVPLLAIGSYLKTSNFQPDAPGASPTMAVAKNAPSVAELIKQVETRVNEHPNDQQGLFILAQTYASMGRYKEAANRYGQLIKLAEPSADLLSNYADSVTMANDRVFTETTANILNQALALEPTHVSARWLAGLAEQQLGRPDAALRHWLRLQPLLNDAESSTELAVLIEEVTVQLGQSAEIIIAEEQVVSSAQTLDTPIGLQLTVSVEIAAELQSLVEPSDTVFIFAKAQSGPPMPLAVARYPASSLPLTITLDDSMAMLPQMKLSNFEDVVVAAHISKSGQAISQSGDFQSQRIATKNSNPKPIALKISERKP